MQDAKELNECLCCGSERLKLVLDLNEQPLANSFKKTAEEAEPTFPLCLNICEACTHLHRTIQGIKDLGMKAGVAINPHSPVNLLSEIIDCIDLVCVMSVKNDKS